MREHEYTGSADDVVCDYSHYPGALRLGLHENGWQLSPRYMVVDPGEPDKRGLHTKETGTL